MIEYFYTYKNIIGSPWDSVLNAVIPRFALATAAMEYNRPAVELCNSINDSRSQTYSMELDKYINRFAPVTFSYVEEKIVVKGSFPHSERRFSDNGTGVSSWDTIVKRNGKRIASVIADLYKYQSHSNFVTEMCGVCFSLTNGSETDTLRSTVESGSNVHEVSVPMRPYRFRAPDTLQKTTPWKILDGNIGYINVGDLKTRDFLEMMRAMQNWTAVVLDVRNYPHNVS